MQNVFFLDGKNYDIDIFSMKRRATISDGENAGMLMNGNMSRDIIGTFYDYSIAIQGVLGALGQYDAFFEAATAPKETHSVTVPFAQGLLTFDCLIDKVTDSLIAKKASKAMWSCSELSLTASAPQRKAGETQKTYSSFAGGSFSVDGVLFPVEVTELTRNGTIIENGDRINALNGDITREIIASYISYTLSIEIDGDAPTGYDELFYLLTAPVNSHTIKFPYAQSEKSFTAYVTKVEDELKYIRDRRNGWGEMKIEFMAAVPYRR